MTASAETDYVPRRQSKPRPTGQPIEIDLVFNVTACGSCEFFWPADTKQQPYGPFPSFDMRVGAPVDLDTPPSTVSFPWLKTTTRPPSFPTPELMDGCRKAPIMTIGINPNLTAFAPGQMGAAWCYPNFSDDPEADLWAKYAYYYRYRTVYQERFELAFVERFFRPEPRVVAPRGGVIVSAERTSSSPSYELRVRYDGDLVDTIIPLAGEIGAPRWVVPFDTHPPADRFGAGDVIAATLEVPAGEEAKVYRQQVGYYEQFVPVLEAFQELLRASGHQDAQLRMGEDVCQLDMVACASPHWNPAYLGGTPETEGTIISNCVSVNAWAIKQLVQTKPAVLYLVGEATYNMFRDAFGALIERTPPLDEPATDGAFTLLGGTTDAAHPSYIVFETAVEGVPYRLRTRLVVTPHFSYSATFTPQFRLSPATWQDLQTSDPACAGFLTADERLVYVPPLDVEGYTAFLIEQDAAGVHADLQRRFPASAVVLEEGFYDPHAMMFGVLADLYASGELAYGPVRDGSIEALERTTGACRFCVNDLWQFPRGCPYGKPVEEPPPTGYLEQVAAALVAAGRPQGQGHGP